MTRHERSFSARRRGFTLLEITLVIGLLAILTAGVFGFIFDLIDARDRLKIESDRAQQAARLMDFLEHAVMTTTVDHGWGPGISGGAERLTIAGMTLALDEDGLAPARVVRLRYDQQARAIVADITAERAGSGRGERVDLVTGVERVRFRYLAGRNWSESFSSANAGSLPRAVEVAIWFAPARELETPPETMTDPAMAAANPLGESAFGPGTGAEAPAGAGPWDESGLEDELPERAPDRYRIIAVPDAEAIGATGASPSDGFGGFGGAP